VGSGMPMSSRSLLLLSRSLFPLHEASLDTDAYLMPKSSRSHLLLSRSLFPLH
jgi:hypothetical protein